MDRQLIESAARALSVQAVLLRTSSIRADDALLPPTDLELSVVAEHRRASSGEFGVVEFTDDDESIGTVVIFLFRTGVRLVDHPAPTAAKGKKPRKSGDAADKVRLEITAEFGAHYRLLPGSDVEALESALKEFGSYNVGLHVWPYWREYVQSTCARLGIPAISVGMYKLPQAKLKAKRG